jgi:predicted membrane channel-forming protein YqfA (hemolysin III family)
MNSGQAAVFWVVMTILWSLGVFGVYKVLRRRNKKMNYDRAEFYLVILVLIVAVAATLYWG